MSPRVARIALGSAALVAVGVAIGGALGGVAALGGLAIARWRGYRAVAAAALLFLLVAAVLTVLEAPTTGEARDYLFDFALDRPIAAEAGRIAGVLTVVAVALAAIRERATPSDSAEAREHPGDSGT